MKGAFFNVIDFFCLIIIYSLRVFHVSVSWLFSTGVCMTSSLLKSPGLFSVEKSPGDLRRLVLADLNNAVVWTVFIHPVISNSSSPCTNPLMTLSRASFSHQRWLMVLYWSLIDSKFLRVSRTPLSILADLINAVVQMILTRPPISNFSNPLPKPLKIIPSALITTSITITFIFRGVVVIAVGNEHGDTSSNPGRYWLHFT